MTTPDPRDEAPRWRWELYDGYALLVTPEGGAILEDDAESLPEVRERIVDTLNAGEDLRHINRTLRADVAREQDERDALQERVTALTARMNEIHEMAVQADWEGRTGPTLRSIYEVAERALAGTPTSTRPAPQRRTPVVELEEYEWERADGMVYRRTRPVTPPPEPRDEAPRWHEHEWDSEFICTTCDRNAIWAYEDALSRLRLAEARVARHHDGDIPTDPPCYQCYMAEARAAEEDTRG